VKGTKSVWKDKLKKKYIQVLLYKWFEYAT